MKQDKRNISNGCLNNEYSEVVKLIKEFREKIWKIKHAGSFNCRLLTSTFDSHEDLTDNGFGSSLLHRKVEITFNLYNEDSE